MINFDLIEWFDACSITEIVFNISKKCLICGKKIFYSQYFERKTAKN